MLAMISKPAFSTAARAALLYATVVNVDPAGLSTTWFHWVKPWVLRLFSVCGRLASPRPVMKKTAIFLLIASLYSVRVDGMATPISLVASAWEFGPKVKLSAAI